ncbi:ADP-dependent glucokinase-like [Montipora capricornis]|uniref:ADP-dependent glucokinase-like n=1 Tax=Montipora capricornis TaxID=246305 RepID=UPI0035F15AD1
MANVLASTLSILVVIAAYLYYKHVTSQDKRVLTVLDGLMFIERQNPLQGTPKVASSFEATIDYYVDSLELLGTMRLEPPEEAKPHDIVKTERDLLETFAFFFNHSAASSRYVEDKELFHNLAAKSLEIKGTRKVLGGSGLQIGKRLAKEGCHVLVAADSTTESLNMLPQNMSSVGRIVDSDDIHLLLEYPAYFPWGKYKSRRANRLVLHSDEHNPYLRSLDKFQEKVQEFSPDIMVVSGLHMLDNFPGFNPGDSANILNRLSSFLDAQKIPVHFEMAPFHQETFFGELMRYIIPYAESMGMNEQELPNLWSKLLYGNITVVSSQKPRVAKVLDLMRDVYKACKDNYKTGKKKRQLTRIHLHTLAFQAILTTKGSNWKNTKAAAAKASLTATRFVCGSETIDPKKSKLFMDDSFSKSVVPGSPRVKFNPSSPVSCWDENDYEICVAPVLVCTQVLQTGGGGDHITAGGLVLQI